MATRGLRPRAFPRRSVATTSSGAVGAHAIRLIVYNPSFVKLIFLRALSDFKIRERNLLRSVRFRNLDEQPRARVALTVDEHRLSRFGADRHPIGDRGKSTAAQVDVTKIVGGVHDDDRIMASCRIRINDRLTQRIRTPVIPVLHENGKEVPILKALQPELHLRGWIRSGGLCGWGEK